MYIPGRHADLLDWLASSSGALCACVAVLFFKGHFQRNSPGGCTRFATRPAWREHQEWTERKYAAWKRGERMPTQKPSSLMTCPCGQMFDSHRLRGHGHPCSAYYGFGVGILPGT
jgi:hypothetical protein